VIRNILVVLWLLCAVLAPALAAQVAAQPPTPAGASAPAFDVQAAVDAYLSKVPPDRRALSDAYFEGGYWLILWDFLTTALALWLILHFRLSAGMRNLAERATRLRWLQTLIYSMQFIVLLSLITFPMTLYESYFREHQYNMLNQTFGPWLRDQFMLLLVEVVLYSFLLVALFAVVQRVGKSWWVWGAVICVAFLAFAAMIAPVFIFPLFNKFTRLQDSRVRDPILSLARANGIPATEVYEFDASRQSNRVSANVSGFAGTTRISLNDNMLNRCTLPEIEASMGHEMGHYVLNHQFKGLAFNAILAVIGFAFINWALLAALNRWGAQWNIGGISDVAVLPLALLLFSLYAFTLTPVQNTLTRNMEYEADIFGLNAAQQPDGASELALKLGEYRKLAPGPVEEFIFFDHPSGRTRITAAMRWKAEHVNAGATAHSPGRRTPCQDFRRRCSDLFLPCVLSRQQRDGRPVQRFTTASQQGQQAVVDQARQGHRYAQIPGSGKHQAVIFQAKRYCKSGWLEFPGCDHSAVGFVDRGGKKRRSQKVDVLLRIDTGFAHQG